MTKKNKKQKEIQIPLLINAYLYNKYYSDSFMLPCLINLDVGSIVKVCDGFERFWVKVTKIDFENLEGKIDNILVTSESYNKNDIIAFQRCNIFEIFEFDKKQ